MAKRAHAPNIPVSDGERLTQAAHVLKAAIVAMSSPHVNIYASLMPGKSIDIDLSMPMESAHSLIEKVIGHRRDRRRVLAKREIPGQSPPSVTFQLFQVLHLLKVMIETNEGEPEPADGIEFSYPLWTAVSLIEEASERMAAESDEEFERRNPRVFAEAELMGARPERGSHEQAELNERLSSERPRQAD